MRNILYLCFLAFFLLGISTQAEARKKKKSGKEIAKEEKKTESLTPYQKLFEGKKVETAKGIMTVHKVDGKVYVEFPLSLQNKDMLGAFVITAVIFLGRKLCKVYIFC